MKIQNLAIIFLVIAIPLILIVSYYLNLQQDTLKLQAEYDTKLSEATKEGIKAFEVNTVDWTEWESKPGNLKIRNNVQAMINTFTSSLANNLNISGTAKEYMLNYIPATVITMYNGYYVYAPAKVPVTAERNGAQLFWNAEDNELTTDSTNGSILYKAESGGRNYTYKYTDEQGYEQQETYENLTDDISKAKTEYKHTLSNLAGYSARYTTNNKDINVVVNYTLDNKISVYGKVGDDESVKKSGYLVYFNFTNSIIPQAYTDTEKEENIDVTQSLNTTKYNNIKIEPETLEEKVVYLEDDEYKLNTFKYVYDINHQKLYYDETKENFFTLNSDKERQFINNGNNIKIGSDQCKYKSVSVLWGDSSTNDITQYKKFYQVLNGKDKGTWCISLKEENRVAEGETEIIDTKIDEKKEALGLTDIAVYQDCSDISYYVEACAFTNWVRINLSKNGLQQELVKYNARANKYETIKRLEAPVDENDENSNKVPIKNIFNINSNNDPEEEFSPFYIHKTNVMKNNITANLKSAISSYNGTGKYDYKLPVLSSNDWDQLFSNISLLTFFQGVPIGLKYYNNYAIATSTSNREYVDPNEIYFTGKGDSNYHRALCEKCEAIKYTGYRSVEYVLREYKVGKDNTIYYYQHNDNSDSKTGCYYCAINKANYTKKDDDKLNKSYHEALARERYYQNNKVEADLYENLNVTITYPSVKLTNTDIIFVLDESASIERENIAKIVSNFIGGIELGEDCLIGATSFSSTAHYSNSIGNYTGSISYSEWKDAYEVWHPAGDFVPDHAFSTSDDGGFTYRGYKVLGVWNTKSVPFENSSLAYRLCSTSSSSDAVGSSRFCYIRGTYGSGATDAGYMSSGFDAIHYDYRERTNNLAVVLVSDLEFNAWYGPETGYDKYSYEFANLPGKIGEMASGWHEKADRLYVVEAFTNGVHTLSGSVYSSLKEAFGSENFYFANQTEAGYGNLNEAFDKVFSKIKENDREVTPDIMTEAGRVKIDGEVSKVKVTITVDGETFSAEFSITDNPEILYEEGGSYYLDTEAVKEHFGIDELGTKEYDFNIDIIE